MFLTRDTSFYLIRGTGKELCCYNHIFTFCKIAERSSDILLTGTALISYGRIKEIHAQIKAVLYDLS